MAVVFTNGCFDIIHPGHVDLLARARALGDYLIVGLNSDASVRAVRGAGRPLVPQDDRAAVLRGLGSVDEVIIFDDPTPLRLIESVKPDVLVKGGDWPIDQIVGADFVLQRGGKVFSLPLKEGYSTTALVEKIAGRQPSVSKSNATFDGNSNFLMASLREHVEAVEAMIATVLPTVEQAGDLIVETIKQGNKILLCGNGGSAADAQHIAAELLGRFEVKRRAYPAIALTTDTSNLTAISNDFGFEQLFARQVEGLAQPNDLLVGISTSGNSPNVIAAIMTARRVGCRTVGLTGAGGKRLSSLCDVAVLAPSNRTARVQEMHITIGHLWCEMVDRAFAD